MKKVGKKLAFFKKVYSSKYTLKALKLFALIHVKIIWRSLVTPSSLIVDGFDRCRAVHIVIAAQFTVSSLNGSPEIDQNNGDDQDHHARHHRSDDVHKEEANSATHASQDKHDYGQHLDDQVGQHEPTDLDFGTDDQEQRGQAVETSFDGGGQKGGSNVTLDFADERGGLSLVIALLVQRFFQGVFHRVQILLDGVEIVDVGSHQVRNQNH